MKKTYNDDQLRSAVSEVTNMSQLLTKLGLKPRGANYVHMRKRFQELGDIDTDHWNSAAWNKGHKTKDYSEYTSSRSMKRHLVLERGHRCERCLNETWFGIPIILELDHVSGDRTDNSESNLQLLCPNCHSQTPTWRGRKST